MTDTVSVTGTDPKTLFLIMPPNHPNEEAVSAPNRNINTIKNKGAYHPDDLKDMPPDGGTKAWTAAICSMLYCFTSWGSLSSYSVFLNFYITNNEFPGVEATQYSMIAGTTIFLLFWGWLVSALLSVLHIKLVMAAGSVLQFAGMLMASFTVKYWQLLLTEGLLSGFGCSFLFLGSVTLIPSWFLKKRTVASGLGFAGTGIGGCVFSLVAEAMIDRTGDQRWALRTIAIICLFLNVIATALVELRKPKDLGKANATQGTTTTTKIQTFKNALLSPIKPRIWFLKANNFINCYFALSSLGYVVLLYSLSNFAVSVGLTSRQAAHCLAVLNACQFVGRMAIGLISDHMGRINITLLMSTLVTIFTFAYWIPISNYSGVMSFSVFMGLVMGYQFVTISPIIADFNGLKNFAASWSITSVFVAIIGLVAEVITLAMRRDNNAKPYLNPQIFTGVAFFISTLFILPIREIKVKRIIESWRDTLLEEILDEKNNTGTLEEGNTFKENKRTGDGQQLPINTSSTNIEEQKLRQQQQEEFTRFKELLEPTLKSYIKRTVLPIVA